MTSIRTNSAWSLPAIESALCEWVIPVRLACVKPDGSPIVCSLWYIYDEGTIWCATRKNAKVTGYLANHPVCGFEISPEAPPYSGVRGQGKVTIMEEHGAPVLLQLIDRYLQSRETDFSKWLIRRSSSEVAFKIEPSWMTAWDFSARMPPVPGKAILQ